MPVGIEQRVTAPALVLGWGNSLRGDDAAGRLVARALARDAGPDLRVLEVHQLTPELGEDIAHAARVVFVDAAADLDALRVQPVQPRPAAPGGAGHHCCPEGLLDLARQLYGRAPEAWLVAVPADNFSLGTGLSARTRAAVREAAAAVRTLLCRQPKG